MRSAEQASSLTDSDRLLAWLARQAFQWLQDNSHPATSLVLDRGANSSTASGETRMASIASVGHRLSLLPYAEARGWIDSATAHAQADRTLAFVESHLEHRHGLLYHFVDWETGQRWPGSEFSLLDTAIFLNGCMVAGQAFPAVSARADSLLDRVEWSRYLIPDPASGSPLLSLGYLPEDGRSLLTPADIRSSEMAMAYFLATGASADPINADVWYNTHTVYGDICGVTLLNPEHPLFTSYYGLGWADLEGLVDREGIDLHSNARSAAMANRTYCLAVAATSFATYSDSEGRWWGLSAGDSPAGYVARGPGEGDPYGTVWPMAALGAIAWIPDLLFQDVPGWVRSSSWERVCGEYGISPFTVDHNWVGSDVIGIDLGAFALSWIRHEDGLVSDLWMSHPIAQRALDRLGY